MSGNISWKIKAIYEHFSDEKRKILMEKQDEPDDDDYDGR